jgi:hypothetical protein
MAIFLSDLTTGFFGLGAIGLPALRAGGVASCSSGMGGSCGDSSAMGLPPYIIRRKNLFKVFVKK